jgi:hypothetical protein
MPFPPRPDDLDMDLQSIKVRAGLRPFASVSEDPLTQGNRRQFGAGKRAWDFGAPPKVSVHSRRSPIAALREIPCSVDMNRFQLLRNEQGKR